jgi:beta-galactosidase
VTRVVRRVLDRHGLVGPYADATDLETAVRVTPAGRRIRFLLNHLAERVTVSVHCGGTDLLTGVKIRDGQPLTLEPYGVLVLAEGQKIRRPCASGTPDLRKKYVLT